MDNKNELEIKVKENFRKIIKNFISACLEKIYQLD